MAHRPLPKQIQRIRQNSIESSTSSNGSRGPRTASVRLISNTSSQLSDLPEDMVVGNDDVIDEAENNDGFEGKHILVVWFIDEWISFILSTDP